MHSSHSLDVVSSATACLPDEVLIDLLEGRLSDEELARSHQHAAGCGACRTLMASVTRGVEPEPGETRSVGPIEVTVTEPGLAWTPPETFDEFRLERVLGRGGMGVVYLAHDTSLGRRVAVKFIASPRPDPWVRAYFETEARIIARLQHPNVVTVFRVGEVGGHPYIVSEYVVGQSLAELSLPVPWRRVLTLGVGLARGLAAAHRQGVLHRDLKPSNALVTEGGEVKLLDFGLAERFEPGEVTPASRAHSVVGTRPYLAPELLEGSPATPRSDLYALGLVLQELCTGELPRGPARERETRGPRTVGGVEIDPDFDAIISRCLAPEPLERFASAEALCGALERLERLSAPAPLVADNPYRGLAPFEAEHRSLFFGRDADIHAVLERLRHQSIVLVAGDSGTGKSSLCRAGVLPRVDADLLGGARERSTVSMWPGRRPLETLAAALAPWLDRKESELVPLLADSPAWLGRTLRELHLRGRGLVLFVDQLEELITLSEPEQVEPFARILGELSLPSRGVRVLLTVRGDFLTRLCALPGLGEEAERALYLLRPLSPEGVREAIVGPARGRGVGFESAQLVQTLVDSTAHGVGSLPPLQFALAELWERRHPAEGRITQAALEAMGGVAGALSRHADGVLARLSGLEREAARRLLLHLVTVEGTRIERGEQELIEATDEVSRTALRALVEGRLLHTRTAHGQSRYEIAHDSLIHRWGTLRDWLDDDIGQRTVRKRVETASIEWERLKSAREALWGRRQLDEVRSLEPASLGPRERAFLLASRRGVMRQRWVRWLAGLTLVLALAASYGVPRLLQSLEDERVVTAQLGLSLQEFDTGHALAQQADARREEAFALFDGRASASGDASLPSGAHGLANAESVWAQALELRAQADAAYARTGLHLERVLDRDRGHVRARGLIAQVLYERILLADRFHQQSGRDEWALRLSQMAETMEESVEWWRRLQAPAELGLETTPPGARVSLERYVDKGGRWVPEPVVGVGPLGPTPLSHLSLPAGSYLVHVTSPDPLGQEVRLPLLLAHGASEQIHLTLPRTAPPKGYVYIPPGTFLSGSAEPAEVRQSMLAPPLHRVRLHEGYVIGIHEVTFGDWLEYLESPSSTPEDRRLLEEPPFSANRAFKLWRSEGTWHFSLLLSGQKPVLPDEKDGLLHYRKGTAHDTADWHRLPLSGVSARDLKGYFEWLRSSGRVPGARLCTQQEWEYAARGADGRRYPHGNQLRPEEANIDMTYRRDSRNFGPDEVGSYPDSVSPFGVQDMAGNALELVTSTTPELGSHVFLGGGWYYDSFGAEIANVNAGEETTRDARIGVRVCAPFPP